MNRTSIASDEHNCRLSSIAKTNASCGILQLGAWTLGLLYQLDTVIHDKHGLVFRSNKVVLEFGVVLQIHGW